MVRDSFIFYRSIYEAIRFLPAKDKLGAYEAICDYALNGNMPQISGTVGAIFTIIRPQIDVNNIRFENGKKGGRPLQTSKSKPKNNQTITKPELINNQTITKPKPMVIEKSQNAKPNVNVNDNVNVNVNVSSTEDDSKVVDVVKILPTIKIDCSPIHSLQDYKKASTALLHSTWARQNLTFLSKIHGCWDKLLSGFYSDRLKALVGSVDVVSSDFDANALNDMFDKLDLDLI